MAYRVSLFALLAMLMFPAVPTAGAQEPPTLQARVIAAGIVGPGAIAQVGAFHAGGPIHDKPDFAAFTQPGRLLDPDRILVAAQSNYGAPLADPGTAPGAVLSIDPRGTDPIVVQDAFAVGQGQVVAANGRLQLVTAQSPTFINGVYNPEARTASLPPVSRPLAISINNGFGRLWFANAPIGLNNEGTESIVDPDGRPLAGAPSLVAGGVFSGDLTNRQPDQLVPGGLDSAAVGTALLGKSPDGSGRAVFAILEANGRLIQANTEQALDGLAPPGTITPLGDVRDPPATVDRAGVLFNWVPDRILYVADPMSNRLAAVTLTDDNSVFQVAETRSIEAPEFNVPIDLAPVVPEVANPTFSSNTTLAGGSDLYVLNWGDSTIVRVRQNGSVVDRRRVAVPGLGVLQPRRLRGIAVSRDAARLWLTVDATLPGLPAGAVVEVPTF